MFASGGKLGMVLAGMRTKPVKKDENQTDLVIEMGFSTQLDRTLIKRLGPVIEHCLLAAEVDHGEGEGAGDGLSLPFRGTVALEMEVLEEEWDIKVYDKASAKKASLTLPRQKIGSLKVVGKGEPRLRITLTHDVKQRIWQWLPEHLNKSVHLDFQPAQARLPGTQPGEGEMGNRAVQA